MVFTKVSWNTRVGLASPSVGSGLILFNSLDTLPFTRLEPCKVFPIPLPLVRTVLRLSVQTASLHCSGPGQRWGRAHMHVSRHHLGIALGNLHLWPWPLADPAELGTWCGPSTALGLPLCLMLPSGSLALRGSLGTVATSRVTLYFPAVFYPESSKQFTDRGSLVLSPGIHWW